MFSRELGEKTCFVIRNIVYIARRLTNNKNERRCTNGEECGRRKD
jgi:hypothetical protein